MMVSTHDNLTIPTHLDRTNRKTADGRHGTVVVVHAEDCIQIALSGRVRRVLGGGGGGGGGGRESEKEKMMEKERISERE